MRNIIGANIEEAVGAISKKDFLNKVYIAHKKPEKHHIGFDYLLIQNI